MTLVRDLDIKSRHLDLDLNRELYIYFEPKCI